MRYLAVFSVLTAIVLATLAGAVDDLPWQATAPATAESGDELEALRAEVERLRDEVEALRRSMEFYIDGMMKELQNQSALLTDALGRLDAERFEAGPRVPRPRTWPGDEPVRLPEMPRPPPSGDPAPPVAPVDGVAPADYRVVDEWGRSPEDAARLGPGVSSLAGMVCVVPEGVSDGALAALGRQLRQRFAGYDNIHIEVFDDEDAARLYADRHETRQAHHVLTVSKHDESGMDTILIVRGGINRPVRFDP